MKLPNFDEFEPLIAIRKKMDAKGESPLSLVKIDRLNAVEVDNAPLDWSTPRTEKTEISPPPKQISAPPAPTTPAPTMEAPKKAVVAPITPKPTITKPTIVTPKPTQKTAARPTKKAPPAPTKAAELLTRVLAVIAFTAVLVAVLVALMVYKKKDYVPAAKPPPPQRVQPQKTMQPPPPAQKIEAPSATTTPVATSTPPTDSTTPAAVAPSIATPPSPATPTAQAPSTPDMQPTAESTEPAQPVILTPDNNEEVTIPQASDDTTITDENEKAKAIGEPTPEDDNEMIGIRIGETPPDGERPAERRPSNPAEFDLNERPFSDALRNAGKSWYTKVEKRPKKTEEEQ